MSRYMRKANRRQTEVEIVIEPETEIQAPDGGWGWVVCFAVFFVNFVVNGITQTNGVLLLALLDLFNDSLSKTTIVSSLISGATMFGGPFVSIALMFKVSHRQIMMVGGIIAAASAVASSFAPNVDTLIFTHGILSGLSLALNYFTANVTLGCYFVKKRAVALGIAGSGIGFGSFALNYLSTKMIPFYGMRGTFLLIGGLFLNLTVVGALCRPLKPVRKQSPDNSKNGRNSIIKMEGAVNPGFSAEDENKETRAEQLDTSSRRISEDIELPPKTLRVRMSITSDVVPMDFGNKKTSYCDATMLKNKYFYLFLAVYTMHARDSLQIYLPMYAVSIGLSRDEGAMIMAIYGIAAIASQLLFGLVIDIIHIPISYVLLAVMCSVSLGSILAPFCQSFGTVALCAVLLSVGHNVGTSLRILLIAGILGIEKITPAYSIVTTITGTLYILYPILSGFVYEATQQLVVVFYLDSAIAFLGAVFSCGIVYAQKTGKFVE